MLACVCRPVAAGSLPKPPHSMAPQKRPTKVVTSEPRIATAIITTKKVPGRPTAAELRAMALRQQQQIDTQHQLLAAKEQRLRFLKAQEARGAAAAAEGERLRRLRERVEAQESKLRRLRALRGQVDLQKTYNVTLSNDLDSIRALFSEKEKELSLAVAKVEALTRQLEELRRDRRGSLNLMPGVTPGSNQQQQQNSPAARELEKLRRELMYRNQISLQQDARLHFQREALQQRQAELRSVDQRIFELQTRLQRKKASNLQVQAQQPLSGPTFTLQQAQQPVNGTTAITTGVVAVSGIRPSTNVYPSQRIIPRGNVAAVEPYVHTPQKPSGMQKNTTATGQISQDLATLKLQGSLGGGGGGGVGGHGAASDGGSYPDSDENKLARQKHFHHQSDKLDKDNIMEGVGDFSVKKNDPKYQTLPYNTKFAVNFVKTTQNSTQPSLASLASLASLKTNESDSEKAGESNSGTIAVTKGTTVHSTPLNTISKSVAVPVSGVTATVTTAPPAPNSMQDEKPAIKPKALHHQNQHQHQQIPSGNLVVPPRKPISSVAPTSVALAPKIVAHSPKVNMVAPNVINQLEVDKGLSRPALPPKPNKQQSNSTVASEEQTSAPQAVTTVNTAATMTTTISTVSSQVAVVSVINKAPLARPAGSDAPSPPTTCTTTITPAPYFPPHADNLPIKARPLTIKKQPFAEQPRLRSNANVAVKTVNAYANRRIEMPPSFLFPEIETADLKDSSHGGVNHSPNNSVADETDKSTSSSMNGDERSSVEGGGHSTNVVRRMQRPSMGDIRKTKLARRVSFDPLALLLDASLEGELELVRKTATQVTNPSAANDEGITALHNAICAGHLEIVKFLVEYGCDVNAQDSDGWTPLHCAASCNNLAMVKFLVESGACLFAATLSDHETPAEKCEEDEEGFDGCSEYLYSIQEKLGILHSGEVYAVFAYDSQQSDELSFTLNDRLTILRKGDDAEREWWWARNHSGKEGYIPRNLLGLYPRVSPQFTAFIE